MVEPSINKMILVSQTMRKVWKASEKCDFAPPVWECCQFIIFPGPISWVLGWEEILMRRQHAGQSCQSLIKIDTATKYSGRSHKNYVCQANGLYCRWWTGGRAVVRAPRAAKSGDDMGPPGLTSVDQTQISSGKLLFWDPVLTPIF